MSKHELPDPIDRFVETVNQGNTESLLDFFHAYGVVDDSGRRFVGHDEIRRWSDRELIGAKGRMTITSVEQTNEEIRLRADWVSNYFTGPSLFIFVIKDKKIQEMRIRG